MRARYVRGTAVERFWPKVDKDGPVSQHAPDLGPCWLWTAALRGDGYGVFKDSDGKLVRAHRWAYEHEHGPIPDGLEPDHLCRVKCCVRPSHMEPVTHQENSRRGLPGGRVWRRSIATCPQGHPYDEENTYVAPSGFRRCRACRNERQRRARANAR